MLFENKIRVFCVQYLIWVSVLNTKYGNTEKKIVPTSKLDRVKNGLKPFYLRKEYGFSVFNTKYGFSVYNTNFGSTRTKYGVF